jgi:hypothetical protein
VNPPPGPISNLDAGITSVAKLASPVLQIAVAALLTWALANIAIHYDFNSLLNLLWIVGLPVAVNWILGGTNRINFAMVALLCLVSIVVLALVATGDLIYYNL